MIATLSMAVDHTAYMKRSEDRPSGHVVNGALARYTLMMIAEHLGAIVVQTCAQVLLSLGNLASRIQYLNASNTFTELFSYGTVPIVNENDTVAVEELRIGDNDTLSAQASSGNDLFYILMHYVPVFV